jgi:8-oxo-dGTP pyrophosphatase MutT (NUDIX family)
MQSLEETSYGIIPLRFFEGNWQVLLIQHKTGSYWSFPKGHGERHESPKETAIRELHEETGLEVVRFLKEETLKKHYQFAASRGFVSKTVVYFIAEVKGEIKLQRNEVMNSKWLLLQNAVDQLTFPQAKQLFTSFLKIWELDHPKNDDPSL